MKVNIFKITLLIVFIFGIMLDISFQVFPLVGHGEIISLIDTLNVSGELVGTTESYISIELLDILALFVLLIFFVTIKKRQDDLVVFIDPTLRLSLILWVLFIIFVGSSLLLNWSYYTQSQMLVMFMHWLKLVEMIALPIILTLLLRGFDAKRFTLIFLSCFILSSLILLATNLLFNYKMLIGDRMETSISLMIGLCFIFYLYELETNKRKLIGYEKWLYSLAVFLGSLFILTAHKRSAILGLLILIIVISAICIYKKRSKHLMSAFLISLIISSSTLVGDFQRSIVPEFEGINKSRFSRLLLHTQDDLAQEVNKSQEVKTISGVREFLEKIVIHLDGSGAERVAKYIYSFNILSDYKIYGDGFLGSKFRYNFLPDSIMQIPIEIGCLGFLICIIFFITLFRVVKPYHFSFVYLRLAFLPFFITSLFCNPIYMFRPMAALLFFISYTALKFGKNDSSKIVDKSSAQVRR